MPDDDQQNQGPQNTGNNTSKPAEVKPPEYDNLRESVDPSKIRGKVIKDSE